MTAEHRRPSRRTRAAIRGVALGSREMYHPDPLRDVEWWKQILIVWDLRRKLHLDVIDVRRLLGDETRSIGSYRPEVIRTAADELRARLPPRDRRALIQPHIVRSNPKGDQ